MADVTGPISSLPGAVHAVPKGTMCDEHPDRPATHRVQGETDSMGCEMIDMCAECYKAYREELKTEDTSGQCEWCGKFADKRRHRRDYEEGMSGRVYQVCDPCIKRRNEEDERELEARGYFDDYDDGDPDPDDNLWADGPDDWEDAMDEYAHGGGPIPGDGSGFTIPGTGPQPAINAKPSYADERARLLEDYDLSMQSWEVDLACVKLSRSEQVRGYETMTYIVHARDKDHAIARARAMLPAYMDVDDLSSCAVKPFVPRDPKQLRAEKDAGRVRPFGYGR